MNVIFDIIIIAIFALSVIIAYKRGFFKTLLHGSAFLIALVITIALVTPVRQTLVNTPVYDGVKNGVSDWAFTEATRAVQDKDDEKNLFSDLLFSLGLPENEYKAMLSDGTEAKLRGVADSLGEKVADAAISVIAAAGLFTVSRLALLLLSWLLTTICKLPVLKQANAILGGLLGAVLGLIRCAVFASLTLLLMPLLQSSGIGFFASAGTSGTLLLSFFANFNLFAFL